jgi:hypothetical protein
MYLLCRTTKEENINIKDDSSSDRLVIDESQDSNLAGMYR